MPRDQSDSTRDRIVVAATQLFAVRGYAATGMAKIFKKARATSGSFYYFFDSKEDLLLAVLDRHIEELESTVIEPAFRKEDEDAVERIFSLLAHYRGRIRDSGCEFACPVGRLALEIGPEQGNVRRKLDAYFAAWRGAIEECLEEDRERFPKDFDLKQFSALVLSVMEGGVMQARAAGSVEPFDRCVEQLRDYVDRLLQEAEDKKEA